MIPPVAVDLLLAIRPMITSFVEIKSMTLVQEQVHLNIFSRIVATLLGRIRYLRTTNSIAVLAMLFICTMRLGSAVTIIFSAIIMCTTMAGQEYSMPRAGKIISSITILFCVMASVLHR